MIEIKQSTASIALVFRMVDSTDHVTGKTGLSPTVTLSKNGGAFASPSGTVSEIADGFYKVAANATDSNTLGILALRATATGADPAAMAFAIVENIESDTYQRLAATPPTASTIASQVRTELATELARIDAAITSRLASAGYTVAPTTAQIRAEIATELARIDAAVSSRNATTPPTVAAIADAVWDEAMADHTTAGTAGNQLTAAGASGDPWATVVPAAYADGTAGAALGRLNNTPAAAPIAVVPAPDEDESLSVVYIYTENIINEHRAGIIATFSLAKKPAKSERALEVASQTATSDAAGLISITLQRNVKFLVSIPDIGLCKTFTPTTETFDLLTIIP